jgi:SAM-dependent methyltransferase
MSGNAEQAELWNGRMGRSWVQVEDYIDRMLAPISDYAVGKINAVGGERIIDIGCGCGTTTIALAGQGAAVWGVDISEAMIAKAKEKNTGATDVHFSVTDAASQAYTQDHDGVFSRFGIMFFDQPVAAFSNIRSALKPSGRLMFLCWQSPMENPWISIAGAAVQPFLPDDQPAPDPEAPGPFSLADPARTSSLLEQSGFSDISIEPVVRDIPLGDDLDEVMNFQKQIGPLSGLLETADEATAAKATQAVHEAFEAHVSSDGVSFSAAAWLVSAYNKD